MSLRWIGMGPISGLTQLVSQSDDVGDISESSEPHGWECIET
jgi:hypothetical protein